MSNSKKTPQKISDERFKMDDGAFEKESEVQDESISIDKEEELQNTNNNQKISDEFDEIIDDAISENFNDDKNLEDNTLENFKEKIRRSGVIYISYIPEGMTVSLLKKQLNRYGVNRVYLVPDKNIPGGKKKQNYKEGWIEFTDKIMAKLCDYELNGKIFGGKKRNNKFREETWNLKYLHKFKWHHLMDKLQFNKKLREHRMKAELSQTKRENNFILEKFEQSKIMNKMAKKRENEILKAAEEELHDENDNIEKEELLLGNKKIISSNKKMDEMIKDYKDKNKIKRTFHQKKPLLNDK